MQAPKCHQNAHWVLSTGARRSHDVNLVLPEKSGYFLYVVRVTCVIANIVEQCVGGIPCESCIRTGKICRKQMSEELKAVYVFYKETESTLRKLIPATLAADTKTIHLDCFFAFLYRNHLVHHTDVLVEVLLPLVSESALLSSVVSAIGALDASRHGYCANYVETESSRFLAYKSYSRSIELLKTVLLESEVSLRDDILWATFFLGLFEVYLF